MKTLQEMQVRNAISSGTGDCKNQSIKIALHSNERTSEVDDPDKEEQEEDHDDDHDDVDDDGEDDREGDDASEGEEKNDLAISSHI